MVLAEVLIADLGIEIWKTLQHKGLKIEEQLS